MTTRATIEDCGDSALRLLAVMPDREANWRLVHLLAKELDTSGIPGVTVLIPAYDSLLIEFDLLRTEHELLRPQLQHAADAVDLDRPVKDRPSLYRVPVVYGGEEYGPDLPAVAAHVGLSPEEVVELHHRSDYTIRCLGAPGGSPMVDGPPFPVPVPRLTDPRVSVPVGAISVAGRQATITPAVAPGGWSLIGRTPLVLMDTSREPLVPYEPGDRLHFFPIGADEWSAYSGRMLVADA